MKKEDLDSLKTAMIRNIFTVQAWSYTVEVPGHDARLTGYGFESKREAQREARQAIQEHLRELESGK